MISVGNSLRRRDQEGEMNQTALLLVITSVITNSCLAIDRGVAVILPCVCHVRSRAGGGERKSAVDMVSCCNGEAVEMSLCAVVL